MEKQFTTEDYNHIKRYGFNPQICLECQEIDSTLNKMAFSGSSTLELYGALEYLIETAVANLKGGK